MFTGETLIGRRVLARQEGQMLDSVKDVVIDTALRRVVALLVNEGRLFSAPTVIPLEKVVSIGDDVIVVSDAASAVAVDQYPMVKEILDRNDRLVGKAVYTEAGSAFGRVVDVNFELPNGGITDIKVASGSEEDKTVTDVKVSIGDVISIGQDAVVISRSTAQGTGPGQQDPTPRQAALLDSPPTSRMEDAGDTTAWSARRAATEPTQGAPTNTRNEGDGGTS